MTAKTLFRNIESTEYFHYDHLAGVLTIVINDGCRKGIMTRCDSQASALPRQFHKEFRYGVPSEIRLFESCSIEEYHQAYCAAVDTMHEVVVESLQS
jgi:hypothetical protein